MKKPVRQINPSKLLLSKWTAVNIERREKHFIVVKLVEPEPEGNPIEWVEIEAVMTRRRVAIRWQELKDSSRWSQGWL